MDKFLMFLVALGILVFGSLGEYICGRIILPAMGLEAPGYWTWFWFMTWGLFFSIPLSTAGKILVNS